MTDPTPLFTVFTPTYNRAHTLERVYHSLKAQTFRDFEWLIVDDGSQDKTADLIAKWRAEGLINIRYTYQQNAGKHVAFNAGVRLAKGELFLTLDSDDTCDDIALARFREHWLSLTEAERLEFSGITCLCKRSGSKPSWGALPKGTIDGRPFEVMSRLRLRGEMWGFHRTDVLRCFPFPEYPNERFVPEGLVWNRIGRRFKIRFVNEALRRYHESPDGLSISTVRLRMQSPCAAVAHYGEALSLPVRFLDRVRAAANLTRFAIGGRRLRQALPYLRSNPGFAGLGILPGLLLAIGDCRTMARQGQPHAASPSPLLTQQQSAPPADPHA